MHSKIHELGPFGMAVGLLLPILPMWDLKHQQPKPWMLSVCVGGVRVHGENVRPLFETPEGQELVVPMPSISSEPRTCLIGKATSWCRCTRPTLLLLIPMRLVVEHGGGHRFPSAKQNPAASIA